MLDVLLSNRILQCFTRAHQMGITTLSIRQEVDNLSIWLIAVYFVTIPRSRTTTHFIITFRSFTSQPTPVHTFLNPQPHIRLQKHSIGSHAVPRVSRINESDIVAGKKLQPISK